MNASGCNELAPYLFLSLSPTSSPFLFLIPLSRRFHHPIPSPNLLLLSHCLSTPRIKRDLVFRSRIKAHFSRATYRLCRSCRYREKNIWFFNKIFIYIDINISNQYLEQNIVMCNLFLIKDYYNIRSMCIAIKIGHIFVTKINMVYK